MALVAIMSIAKGHAQCANCPMPFVASSQATGDSENVVIPKPTSVTLNDVMIAAVHVGWCNAGDDIIAPIGWTLIAQTSNTGAGCGTSNGSIQLATFYKIAGPTEPTSYTFSGATNQIYVGGIVAYSGVSTTDPISAFGSDGLQEDCSNILAPSIVTVATCSRLVAVFFCSVNNSLTNMVAQTSMTERVDVGNTGNHPWGNENLMVADELIYASGATGNRAAALSNCDGLGWVTGAQMIALNCGSSNFVNDLFISNSLTVSPNPSSGVFNLMMGNGHQINNSIIEVYNVLGVKVRTILSASSSIDLAALPKGIYSLKVILPKEILTKKIVLE